MGIIRFFFLCMLCHRTRATVNIFIQRSGVEVLNANLSLLGSSKFQDTGFYGHSLAILTLDQVNQSRKGERNV